VRQTRHGACCGLQAYVPTGCMCIPKSPCLANDRPKVIGRTESGKHLPNDCVLRVRCVRPAGRGRTHTSRAPSTADAARSERAARTVHMISCGSQSVTADEGQPFEARQPNSKRFRFQGPTRFSVSVSPGARAPERAVIITDRPHLGYKFFTLTSHPPLIPLTHTADTPNSQPSRSYQRVSQSRP
jgi:hypothetical protein